MSWRGEKPQDVMATGETSGWENVTRKEFIVLLFWLSDIALHMTKHGCEMW